MIHLIRQELSVFKIPMPAEVWGVILVGLLILFAHAGLTIFNYWSRKRKVEHNNEVAGIIFGVVTLIYSLIIAFVIVAVWENYEDLNQTIEKEAEDLNTVLVHSNMLPDSLKECVAVAIKNYCQKVVNEEWGVPEDHIRFQEVRYQACACCYFGPRKTAKFNRA